MKRIFVFVITAMLLVGAVPVREVRAAEYYSIQEICNLLGLTSSLPDSNNIILNGKKNFVILEVNGFYCISSSDGDIRTKIYANDSYLNFFGSSSNNLVSWTSSNDKVLNNFSSSYQNVYYDYLNYSSGDTITILYANYDISSCDFVSNNFKNINFYLDLYNYEHSCSFIQKETAATCTDSGKIWEECECGAVQNEVEIPALGHSWEQKEVVGSCVEDSKTWEECSACGAIQNEVVTPASGHVWIEKIDAATCTTTGKSWEECGCGEIQNEIELPLVDHSWINKTDPATCTEAGKAWEECSVCFEVQNEKVIEALGHGILIYEVTQEPTISDPGTFIRSCSVCGEIVESGIVPVVTPTPTPRPTATPRPTSTPRPTATPRPSSTPRPTATPRPGVTFTPRPTATPRPTVTIGPTVTPRPTNTPRPTPTPRITVTPEDADITGSTTGLLGVTTVILGLFTEFPLNIIVMGWILLIGVSIYIYLKRSTGGKN